MGTTREFTLAVRSMLRLYRWRRIEPVPWAAPQRPLAAARIGLVSSAGLVLPGQPPFDASLRTGDPSFRVIPSDTDPQQLVETHRSESFDRSGLTIDRNLVLPLDRLREMVRDGAVGALAPHALSFMGSITDPGPLVRDTAPRAAQIFVRDEVDVALLVPV
ncbi:MAG: hypothetical protein IT386_07960 [Deltaproteobacteria bacterium]|nr:hypothetical protein [Deltaproteobacteria bacterium]